jgi:hypothetical protein
LRNEFSILLLAKPLAWLAVVLVATLLLRRQQVTKKVRLAFLIGGVIFFGFLFGQINVERLDTSPVYFLRNLLYLISGQQQSALIASQQPTVLSGTVMLVVLLAITWASNKVICGWGCQLGLLQDLLYRVRLPKWRPPFGLANAIRGVAFSGLMLGIVFAGIDWIKWIDPFQIFRMQFTLIIGFLPLFCLLPAFLSTVPGASSCVLSGL